LHAWWGDEFVVLLPELNDVKHAAVIAEKILAAISKPFTLIGHEFRVTASIGISAYPTDGLDEQTLTKNADVAMYQAKAEGKNNFQFYSESLNANSLERLTLESSLRHALEHKQFSIRYQAKREMYSGRITGMEALFALGPPRLGVGGTDAIHSGGGREQLDAAHRQVGAANRVRPKRGLAEGRRTALEGLG